MLSDKLYGEGELPLNDYQGHRLAPECAEQFAKMQAAAAKDNIAIAICSSYRDFERQLGIWNAKASGQRPVLNHQSQPIAIDALSEAQLVDAILCWSALPGMSRHHWGTDLDLFDANTITREKLQLIASEYDPQGPCHKLNLWLKQYAADFGFYLPYQAGLSGVSPEPWHLSYFPLADQYLKAFDKKKLEAQLQKAPILLKTAILARLDELVAQYVYYVAPSPHGLNASTLTSDHQ
ncbi:MULTISPECIES: M15 family metallopeptidase [Shewanella]|uniref:Peptidase M15 n=1 Tax=Shewanella marisflavi TaxID=260364 RepID=A0AAC9XNR9_9GAMM|nr:M15 family metallopeptidase [Shewanella marisflavi]ASJ96893.1 peptidase M15 [Shewanella marisflavi]